MGHKETQRENPGSKTMSYLNVYMDLTHGPKRSRPRFGRCTMLSREADRR